MPSYFASTTAEIGSAKEVFSSATPRAPGIHQHVTQHVNPGRAVDTGSPIHLLGCFAEANTTNHLSASETRGVGRHSATSALGAHQRVSDGELEATNPPSIGNARGRGRDSDVPPWERTNASPWVPRRPATPYPRAQPS
ncbi:hypothetical protein DL767_005165 [Monosporascus sp. MG133]|nr:hypothetical protein DL767_005165 [Monosporascus sp. MG133]